MNRFITTIFLILTLSMLVFTGCMTTPSNSSHWKMIGPPDLQKISSEIPRTRGDIPRIEDLTAGGAANKIRAFTEQVGGGSGALDAIGCASLDDGDLALVYDVNSTKMAFYWFDDDGVVAEDTTLYSVIEPDDVDAECAGAGNWLMMSSFAFRPTTGPESAWYDIDATDFDKSIRWVVNCPNTGSGAEDCDVTIYAQRSGTDTAMIIVNSDAGIYAQRSGTDTAMIIVNSDAGVSTVLDGAIDTNGSDQTYAGTTIRGKNCGENLAIGDTVYYLASDADPWHEANGATGSGEFPARGIAVAACTDGNEAIIMTQGILRDDTLFDWTVTGAALPIYLGETVGTLTESAPSDSGDCVQVVGWALTANAAYFNFSGHWLEVE